MPASTVLRAAPLALLALASASGCGGGHEASPSSSGPLVTTAPTTASAPATASAPTTATTTTPTSTAATGTAPTTSTPTTTSPPPTRSTPTATAPLRTAPTPTATTTSPPPALHERLLLGLQDDALLASAEPNAWPATRGLHPAVIRYNVAWDAVAPRKPHDPTDPGDPAYDFSTVDRVARLAAVAGARLLLTIVQAPGWANGDRPPSFAPTDPNELGRFCGAVAHRYSGSYTPRGASRPLPEADRFTVWNEPNRRQYFQPQGRRGELAPQRYAHLVATCAPAIHARNPRALVAIGPVASRGEHGLAPLPFLAAYQAAGGPKPDAVALNPYMNGLAPVYLPDEQPADGSITIRNLDQLEQAARDLAGRPVPIWLTEFAWRTAPTPHMGRISPQRQAQLLTQTVDVVRSQEPYVGMLIWFLVRDESPTSYWRSGLVDFDWKRKPAYAVFAALARES